MKFKIKIEGINNIICTGSCNISEPETDIQEIPLDNSIDHVEGRTLISDVTVRFFDKEDIYLKLNEWFDQLNTCAPEDYKREVEIVQYNANDTIQNSWKLIGVFPRSLYPLCDPSNLVELVLVFDDAILTSSEK